MIFEKALPWLCALGMCACASPAQPTGTAAASIAATASTAVTLAGTRWVGVVDAAADPRSAPWLEFMSEGRLSGFSGCNLVSGGWRVEGGQVRIGPLAMTKRGCMGPAGDLERRVLATMNDQARVSREGDKLVMIGPGGERYEFKAVAASPR